MSERFVWTAEGVRYEVLPYDGPSPARVLLSVNGRPAVAPNYLSAAQVEAVLEELLSLGERWAEAEGYKAKFEEIAREWPRELPPGPK